MTQEELNEIKRSFLKGDYTFLQDCYANFKEDCCRLLTIQKYADPELAEDLFCDAIIILRDNIVSGKIEKLSNTKAYLNSVAINLAKEGFNKKVRAGKKINEVRLLYYEKGHSLMEAKESMDEMVRISKNALAKLSKRCQEILVAYYVHNLSMKEIALELNLSSKDVAKTIKSRCYKSWIEHSKQINEL